jgi:hypothetical protein
MSRLVLLGAVGLFLASGLITFFWPVDGMWFASGSSLILDEAHAAVQATLRDPSSALFYDEAVIGTGKSRTVCGNVNAKNGFGGYTGKSAFIYEEQSRVAKTASNSDEAGSIMQSCRLAKLKELKAERARLCDKERPGDPSCKR